jgi:hypothetical protein
MKYFALAALTALVAGPLTAHEPGSDPDADWFAALKNSQGIRCCDLNDCRRTDAWKATRSGLYSVLIGGNWVTVHPENVLHVPNPTGAAVECHSRYGDGVEALYVRCFIPPAGV